MDHGIQTVATAAALAGVSALFVSARLVARSFIIKRPGPEDILITVALVCSIGMSAMIGLQYQNGLGRHIQDIKDPDQIPRMIQKLWGCILLYNLGLALVKVSILVQYLRFFVNAGFRRLCWVMIVLVSLYGTTTILVNIFACKPIPRFWDRSVPGTCINILPFWFANAGWTILTDIIICILPIPMLKSLQLPKSQRIFLIAIFMVGGFGCITSVLRLQSLYVATKFSDITWNGAGAAAWSSIEVNVGIMCACLPTLRPLISYFFPGLLPPPRRRSFLVSRRGTFFREKSNAAVNNEVIHPNIAQMYDIEGSADGNVANSEPVRLQEMEKVKHQVSTRQVEV